MFRWSKKYLKKYINDKPQLIKFINFHNKIIYFSLKLWIELKTENKPKYFQGYTEDIVNQAIKLIKIEFNSFNLNLTGS